MILILSFGQVGSGQVLYQNNGFFILILNVICLYMQIQWKPFITNYLNSLDLKASFIMTITIFCGVFSSACENDSLQTFLLFFILVLNCYFLIFFLRTYFILKMSFSDNSKLSKIFKGIENKMGNSVKLRIIYLSIYWSK